MSRPTVAITTWADGLIILKDGDDARHEFAGAAACGLASAGEEAACAIVGGTTLWSGPLDSSWRPYASDPAGLSCCLLAADRVFVGTDDARVLELIGQDLRVLPGFQATPGREHWYAGTAVIDGKVVGPPLGIRSLAATCDQAVLLASVHVGGIPRSTDGGETWRPTIDIEADVHQVAAHPSRPEIVAAAAAVGLCVSRDGGETWSIASDGLHASHCSAVALTEDWVFVSASVDPFSPEGALYRRRIDADGSLEHVGGGLPQWLGGKVDTYCMSARGDDVVLVDWSGDLYGSRDQGESWSRWAGGYAAPSGVLIC